MRQCFRATAAPQKKKRQFEEVGGQSVQRQQKISWFALAFAHLSEVKSFDPLEGLHSSEKNEHNDWESTSIATTWVYLYWTFCMEGKKNAVNVSLT